MPKLKIDCKGTSLIDSLTPKNKNGIICLCHEYARDVKFKKIIMNL